MDLSYCERELLVRIALRIRERAQADETLLKTPNRFDIAGVRYVMGRASTLLLALANED